MDGRYFVGEDSLGINVFYYDVSEFYWVFVGIDSGYRGIVLVFFILKEKLFWLIRIYIVCYENKILKCFNGNWI